MIARNIGPYLYCVLYWSTCHHNLNLNVAMASSSSCSSCSSVKASASTLVPVFPSFLWSPGCEASKIHELVERCALVDLWTERTEKSRIQSKPTRHRSIGFAKENRTFQAMFSTTPQILNLPGCPHLRTSARVPGLPGGCIRGQTRFGSWLVACHARDCLAFSFVLPFIHTTINRHKSRGNHAWPPCHCNPLTSRDSAKLG